MKGANMSLPKIPLFDIDWTLLKGGVNNKLHHEAFNFTLHNIYNKSDAFFGDVNAEGSIDTRILIEVLKLHGIPEEESKIKMPIATKTMADYFLEHANEGAFEPMPGVVDLLSDLKARGVLLGLLTGNVREIGWERYCLAF